MKRVSTMTACMAVLSFLGLRMSPAMGGTKYWQPADAIGWWDYGPYWSPAGVPVAEDIARVEASGSGFTLYALYRHSDPPLLDRVYVGNTSTGTAVGRIVQGQDLLHTGSEYVGYRGSGEHIQSGGTVQIDSFLYLGYLSGSDGYYELSSGSLAADAAYIGQGGSGEFRQTGGSVLIDSLYLSTSAASGSSIYRLEGGTLTTTATRISTAGTGLFEQSGGAFYANSSGVVLGILNGSHGDYSLTGGTLSSRFTRLAWSGSTFDHSGGTHETLLDLELGFAPDASEVDTYTLSGTGVLDIGDDMVLGPLGTAVYLQNGGTATVADEIEINAGPVPGETGTVRLNSGTLTASDLISIDGYYEQNGGMLSVSTFTNDSPEGAVIQGSADCRARTLVNNQGEIRLLNNAILRGTQALPGIFWICEFTNHGQFQMGTSVTPGGTFGGRLTNHGTFTYYSGDFEDSNFINSGTFTRFAPFSCYQLVNNTSMTASTSYPITAGSATTTYAVENHGTMTISGNGSIVLTGGKPMFNDGTIDARGSVMGDMVNAGLIDISNTTTAQQLTVTGDYEQTAAGNLRLGIRRSGSSLYRDRLVVNGTATLGGALTVTLAPDVNLSLGNTFYMVHYGDREGNFDTYNLPALPNGWVWLVQLTSTDLILQVAESFAPGDFDGDGDVDSGDYLHFADCLNGPGTSPNPSLATIGECLDAFDFDIDLDVDLRDFDAFQIVFEGP